MRPKRSASGACRLMRLPHGQTVSTQSLVSRNSNLVPLEELAHGGEPGQQLLAARHDETDRSAHHVGLAGRHVELAAADIDPHEPRADVEEGIARQPEPGDVVVGRHLLVGDADVHVADIDDVAASPRRRGRIFLVQPWRPSSRNWSYGDPYPSSKAAHGAPPAARHCTCGILASRITAAHFATSALIMAAN